MTGNRPFGRLFVVTTPLGDWDDLTPRAAAALRDCDMIASAGKRFAEELTAHLGIDKPLIELGGRGGRALVETLVEALGRGLDVALLADMRGLALDRAVAEAVAAAVERGFKPVTIPGPSPAAAALALTGLGGHGFHFLNPGSESELGELLAPIRESRLPLLMADTASRLAARLRIVIQALGDRNGFLILGMATESEEALCGPLSALAGSLPGGRAAVVLVVEGSGGQGAESELIEAARELAAAGLSKKDAAAALAQRFDIGRNRAYALVLEAAAPGGMGPSLTFKVRGHEGIRASHAKTVEFKRGPEASGRETCVVGVAADWNMEALRRLRGRVRVEIVSGPAADGFEAEISRHYSDPERMVFRKSLRRTPETLGIAADKSAAELDRDLIRRLSRGEPAVVTITPLAP